MDETIMLLIIRFHTYDARIARGEIKPLFCNKVFSFQGMDQMLLIIDDIMDEVNFQQEGIEHRRIPGGKKNYHFLNSENEREKTEGETPEPDVSVCEKKNKNRLRHVTFTVRIFYRQHSSMQGTLVVKGKRVSFRSALEMIRMMHEYIERVH